MSRQDCLSQTRPVLDAYNFSLPCCRAIVLSCYCLVFRTISLLFESNKTRSGLNVIKTVIFVDENRKQDEENALQEFEGLAPNCENKLFKLAEK